MKKTRSTLLALAAALLSPMAANAGPIVLTGLCDDGVNTCYTGIEDLDINGVLYDVDWYSTRVSFSDVLASDPGVATFAGDPVLSLAAANAINEAFNDAGLNYWILDLAGGGGNVALWTVASFNATTVDFYASFSNSDTVNGPLTDPVSHAGPWAVFTKVPEPGSLALLGIGLLGMGLARRRKV